MRKILRIAKWIALVVLCVLAILQFIRPARTNPVVESSLALESHTRVDPAVAAILDRSCIDCHSNKTRWPWYTNISPVSWFVVGHVNDGREDMNFSEWGRYEKRDQEKMLEGICELATEGEMPLSSYTPMHRGSKLTADDVKTLCAWTERERAALAAR
jgi:hypothetical protein